MNIRILHTNDIHSRFEGVAKIFSKLKELRNENTLVLDAGDFNDFMRLELQGTKGIAGCNLLKTAGYDAIAVGNNEGFAGIDILENMTSSGIIPFLSCNLYKSDRTSIRGLNRSIILEKGGIRFLVIGITPMYNEFFELLNMASTDPIEEINRELDLNKGNYDKSILLSHSGMNADLEYARVIKDIDVIIGGHSHTLMEKAEIVNGTIIHQSGNYAEYLGVLDLEIENGQIICFHGENIKVETLPEANEIMKEIAVQHEIAIEELNQPLYKVNYDIWHDVMEENPMTNLLADALMEVLPCDLSLINSGIINGGIKKGYVTNKKLLEISPSPLNPTYMEIKGKYIKEALQMSLKAETCLQDGRGSGHRGRYLGRLHISNAVVEHNGKDVLEVRIGNELLLNEKIYKVATSDYLQRGTGYPCLANNQNRKFNVEYTRDVLREYLSKKEFAEKSFVNRWIRKEIM